MPKSAPLQAVFNGGELSPLAQGRVDLPGYKRSVATCLNYIPTIQGALIRRPGTRYLGAPKTPAACTRLIPFAPAFGFASMIEMGPLYFRFWHNEVLVLSGPNPLEIAHPYLASEIPQVRYLLNFNIMYFFHPNHPPLCLVDSHFNGVPALVVNLAMIDGPYFDDNLIDGQTPIYGTTMTLGATSGTTTLTLNQVIGINGNQGFLATDVGRWIRMNTGSPSSPSWTWMVVVSVSSSLLANVTIYGPNAAATIGTGQAAYQWRLGLFTAIPGGYPGCGTMHEGRLWLAGSGFSQRRVDASNQGLTPSTVAVFSPTEKDGTVTDASGLDFTFNSRDVQSIVWLETDERGLLVGSTGDEWTLRPDSLSGATTPTNVDAKAATFYGSNPNVAPVKIGKHVLFVQRFAKKLREMGFAFEVNGYRAPDRTMWAEHITGKYGVKEMAHQKEPQSIVWCVLNDGSIAAMTHEEEDGVITTGWHRHQLGGFRFKQGAPTTSPIITGNVLSVGVIPSADFTTDRVWFLVQRVVNGTSVVMIEAMATIPNIFTAQVDFWHVDCAVQQIAQSPSQPFTVVTGLTHLIGQTVTAWADGAPMGNFVVDNAGRITLPYAVSQAQVGLPFNSDGQMLRLEAGAADGTALGKIRRTHRVGMYLESTLNFKMGISFDKLLPLEFRSIDTPEDTATPLFSGIRVETIDSDYDTENMICWRQDDASPGTILAVCPRMDTQDAE